MAVLKWLVLFIGCLLSLVDQRKQIDSNHVTEGEPSISGLTLRSFVAGLVSATVTGVTKLWEFQVVDIVGAAILNFNLESFVANFSIPMNADVFPDFILSQCWMTIVEPGRESGTTSVFQRRRGHHFCACVSLKAIPAIGY